MFIRELKGIKQAAKPHWLLIGDYNLIYKTHDKNNSRVNSRLMLRFRRALNYLEVKELDLIGRKYTWSNNQSSPTQTRIDRAFCTPVLETLYPNLMLQPLSSSISDHYPLLLLPLCTPKAPPIFRFEAFWPNLPGFKDWVQETWGKPVVQNQNSLGVLHIKLKRTAKTLKRWSRILIPNGKLALAVCREVMSQLEKEPENRQLSESEISLIKLLKSRILGLATIERYRAKQRSRQNWMRLGDSNTRFFSHSSQPKKEEKFHSYLAI
jgi:hypothetical protein